MENVRLYECLAATTSETPSDQPLSWKELRTPVDDVRATAGSPYADYGVH